MLRYMKTLHVKEAQIIEKLGQQGEKKNIILKKYIIFSTSFLFRDVCFLYVRNLRAVLNDQHKVQPLALDGK